MSSNTASSGSIIPLATLDIFQFLSCKSADGTIQRCLFAAFCVLFGFPFPHPRLSGTEIAEMVNRGTGYFKFERFKTSCFHSGNEVELAHAHRDVRIEVLSRALRHERFHVL